MNQTGPVRREAFLDSEAAAALLRDPDSFDPTPVFEIASDLYGSLQGAGSRTLLLRPGDSLAPILPGGAKGGFLLDLDPPAWRSEWGGLLLFQDPGGRVHGYRPVPGALTLFPAPAAPLISLISPQGIQRASILGWWT
ncbi:MAG TPA: hypothetical protein VEA44_17475 [Caulobacter sp.]|nr:hypothetical protein [Caulobacter sp.]